MASSFAASQSLHARGNKILARRTPIEPGTTTRIDSKTLGPKLGIGVEPRTILRRPQHPKANRRNNRSEITRYMRQAIVRHEVLLNVIGSRPLLAGEAARAADMEDRVDYITRGWVPAATIGSVSSGTGRATVSKGI